MNTNDSTETVTRPSPPPPPARPWGFSRPLRLDWRMLLVAFLIGAVVVLWQRPWRLIEDGDEAIWDYVAQSILRGQVPYRDVIEIKTPGAAYLSAAAMAVGRVAGINDVLAARLLNVLLVGLLSAVTFAVARDHLRSRFAAVLAFLIPLTPPHFAQWMASGTQPKLPMMLFGMLALLMIAKDRPVWAGLCSMLAFVCWQPGLLFTGTAVLVFSRYLTRWRDGRALRVMAGALVPLAVLLGYFAARGALGDLWKWTIAYNLNFYAPESARSLGASLELLWRVMVRVLRFDVIFVGLGLAGFCGFAVARLRRKGDADEPLAPAGISADALLIAPAVYLAFCLINFQSGPDLIPFFPFIGIFAAWLVTSAIRFIAARPAFRSGKTEAALCGATLILLLGLMTFRAVTVKYAANPTLAGQYREAERIADLLGPDGRIYAHGRSEILVLLGRPNLNPYIYFDRGKDTAAAAALPGGFQQIVDEMEAQAPRLVVVGRLGKVAHSAELEDWLRRHYQPIANATFDKVYIRQPNP